jgi:hypothetical protein
MSRQRMMILSSVAGLLLASSSAGDEPIPLAGGGPRDYRAKYESLGSRV